MARFSVPLIIWVEAANAEAAHTLGAEVVRLAAPGMMATRTPGTPEAAHVLNVFAGAADRVRAL